jgi:uncharacterized protein
VGSFEGSAVLEMAGKHQARKQKHMPQRTCVACRGEAGKRQLIRIVRTEEGVRVDPSGKLAGRGAYLHPNRHCWKVAMESNQLGRALRTRISLTDRQALEEFCATLPEEASAVEGG